MARGRKSSWRMVLSPDECQTLERWQRSTTIAAGLARRGKILLLLAAGSSQSAVAQVVGVQRTVVRKWAKRFLAQRLDGLADAPGRGAKGRFPPRGSDPRGASGLRATGYTGPQPGPVGWHRTGAPAHRSGNREGYLRRHGAADSGLPSSQALAPSSVALSQAASGRSLLCPHHGADRP
jgi:Winged helix-turn helix